MRKVTLIFGLLAGITSSVFSIIIVMMCERDKLNLDRSDLIGYASMVIALSMIFVGIKSYRDNYRSGAISFGRGLQVGILISLIASLIFAAGAEVFYQADPVAQAALMDKYADHHINKLKERGGSSDEIEQKTRQMTDLKEMNKNALMRFVMSVVIILPVGIVISLISAALLRKKEFLPA